MQLPWAFSHPARDGSKIMQFYGAIMVILTAFSGYSVEGFPVVRVELIF